MEGHAHAGEEHPQSHPIQLAVLVAFLPIWVAESFVLRLSTFGSNVMVLPRVFVAAVVFMLGVLLMDRSHTALFSNRPQNAPSIVTTGVFRWVRHPMYSGTLLAYLSLLIAMPSMLSLVILVIGFLAYNRLAVYEEQSLISKFGDEYGAYQRLVSRWLPFIL